MSITNTLKENILGQEVNIPVCILAKEKPTNVFYTYYKGKDILHRIEFRKGSRTTFELFLPRYGKDIEHICSLSEGDNFKGGEDKKVFSFWGLLLLRLAAGKVISSIDLYPVGSYKAQTSLGSVESNYRYRLAYCRRGVDESIILVSSRLGKHSGLTGGGSGSSFNWIKLTSSEFNFLGSKLKTFLSSKEFVDIRNFA